MNQLFIDDDDADNVDGDADNADGDDDNGYVGADGDNVDADADYVDGDDGDVDWRVDWRVRWFSVIPMCWWHECDKSSLAQLDKIATSDEVGR